MCEDGAKPSGTAVDDSFRNELWHHDGPRQGPDYVPCDIWAKPTVLPPGSRT